MGRDRSYVKYNQAGIRGLTEKIAVKQTFGQNYDQWPDNGLRDQPDDFLLSFSGHLRSYDTWQEGLEQIFEVVLKNKPFITNVYHSVSKEKIENYLYKLTYELIIGVVEEKSKGTGLSEENKSFIADFHKYGFVGLMLDWIKQGMKEDYHEIVERMSVMLHGNITNSIQNFEQNKKGWILSKRVEW